MLHAGKVLSALEAKRDHFSQAELLQRKDLDTLEEALQTLAKLDLNEVEARLAGIDRPGARPTDEHTTYESIVVPFPEQWANHREARRWALEVLQDVPTFAVDGSQITPTRDISIPVAMAQVGWFENLHVSGGMYTKNVAIELLTPNDLTEEGVNAADFSDREVNERRFRMELERLVSHMQDSTSKDSKPLCFFDGSLVISFVQQMEPNRQQAYIEAIVNLLRTSKETRIPLVGYIDTSFAKDLATMLCHVEGLHLTSQISDAGLLQSKMDWGDRTQVFVCARDDRVLSQYGEDVCFVYLKTTAHSPPARIDFPRWIYETSRHEPMLDLIRAECIVGAGGYPYALETADAVAVLTMQDRERFYRLVQEFAEREGLPLRFSRKMVSKRGRRV